MSMTKEEQVKLLAALSEANGVSGFEDEVTEVIRSYCADLGEFKRDSLLNVFVERRENQGGRPRIMLDAHTDEVGFMVQALMPNGLLKFIPIGGWLDANVSAQKVRVRNRKGEYITGVVAAKPPHFTSPEEREKAPKISNMAIDIGASSAEEVREDFGIDIAAPVVPDVDFEELKQKENYVLGKAFDCRIGCAAEVMTLKALEGEKLAADVTAVFSTQEEVGTRGVKVSANRVKPDLAICFEGTPADDTFGESYMSQAALGKGPMLRHIDRSMIANPRLMKYVLELAARESIPCQDGVRSGGGTDGGVIHLADKGIPTVVIGVPVRYIHSHYGIADLGDMQAAAKLAEAICRNIGPEEIRSF